MHCNVNLPFTAFSLKCSTKWRRRCWCWWKLEVVWACMNTLTLPCVVLKNYEIARDLARVLFFLNSRWEIGTGISVFTFSLTLWACAVLMFLFCSDAVVHFSNKTKNTPNIYLSMNEFIRKHTRIKCRYLRWIAFQNFFVCVHVFDYHDFDLAHSPSPSTIDFCASSFFTLKLLFFDTK